MERPCVLCSMFWRGLVFSVYVLKRLCVLCSMIWRGLVFCVLCSGEALCSVFYILKRPCVLYSMFYRGLVFCVYVPKRPCVLCSMIWRGLGSKVVLSMWVSTYQSPWPIPVTMETCTWCMLLCAGLCDSFTNCSSLWQQIYGYSFLNN